MNLAAFDSAFDRFQTTAFHLETQAHYAGEEEDAEFALFLAGEPLPEYSVRTDPWLARVAATTAAGKRWQRVHLVSRPLSDYLRFEFASYPANADAGEDVRIADRDAHPDLARLRQDFWLFDADTAHPFAMLQHHDAAGHMVAFETTGDRQVIDRCRRECDLALAWSVPFHQYVLVQGA